MTLTSGSGAWWTANTAIDAEPVFNNSGQSGMLSRLEDRRKIAAASAINFEYRNTRVKVCFSILLPEAFEDQARSFFKRLNNYQALVLP
jgi:hypothetical protein